jgi:hypothetical protein
VLSTTKPLAGIDKKTIILYPAVFAAGLVLFVLLLVGVAMIPRSMIEKHMLESAEYFKGCSNFYYVVDGIEASQIDRYSDAISLSILWGYDSDHPLTSVMWAYYYHNDENSEPENFYEAVNQRYDANKQYLRYWHGSTVIVRLFHLVGNIRQLYVFNSVVIATLVLCLFAVLIRNRLSGAAVSFAAGLIGVSIWIVPLSLEYYWMFLVMLISSLIIVRMELREKDKYIGIAFMITGMFTAYLDFLTTELITLLIPLLLILYIRKRSGRFKGPDSVRDMIGKVILWGIGYAGTWIMKWVIAAMVLNTNTFPYVRDNIEERFGGDYYIISGARMVTDALKRNIKCIFPFEYGAMGALVVAIIAAVIIYLVFVYRRKGADLYLLMCYICIGLLPYIRYVVMRNHSYFHYFFTYRTQMATIVALMLIIAELTARRKD